MTKPSERGVGWFEFPNVVVDEYLAILEKPEIKVLVFIYRKTWGWQKAVDRISRAQFVEGTGLAKKSVDAAITRLCDLELVRKTPHGKKRSYSYTPLVPPSKSVLVSEFAPVIVQDAAPPVETQTGLLSRHTKERNTRRSSSRGFPQKIA